MGAGKSRDMQEFEDAEGDFQELDQSDDERITFIIDRAIKTVRQLAMTSVISSIKRWVLIRRRTHLNIFIIDPKRDVSHEKT